jgi:Xaa-Pro aminopeptidase
MSDKLQNLRAEMKKRGIDGFFIPRADQFQGEYVPDCNSRLEWATGFTGSAGCAVVIGDRAAFFTDGRYTVQARAEVNASDFTILSTSENQGSTPTKMPAQWIKETLTAGQVFGIDPWLHTPAEVKRIRESVEKVGATLVFVDTNPLDAAWYDRPDAPQTPAVPHPLEYAGKASAEKRAEAAAKIVEKSCDALAITLPEEICWLLNVRGDDVPCTPFALSYAILQKDGSVDWFIDAAKIDQTVTDWVGDHVHIHPLEEFAKYIDLQSRQGQKIWVDPNAAPVAIESVITAAGGSIHAEKSPLQLMKAKKNAVEIDGAIRAHVRDGVAMVRFLSVLSQQGAGAKYDEISASDLLEKIRGEGEHFKGLSFDTISGSGGNGAIVHYRSTAATNQPLISGPVYLVDSGAQYLDGTTDITRTLAVDTPDDDMRENYTRVLKGHIAVSTAVFPAGTTGDKIDALARASLKEVGRDYAHGTGHGVGSYLSVHEGPAGISPLSKTYPLEPGMVLSNEPGYYKEGAYGIRIENLVTVYDTGKKDVDGKALYAFKTLTLAPIDTNLIDATLMTEAEIGWLNDYHRTVRDTLLPLVKKVDAAAADYLTRATEPIRKPPAPASKKISSLLL